jgi:hypothetical protein
MSSRQKFVPYVHIDGSVWEHFFVDTKSGMIYFEKKHNGKRIKFTTKEKFPNGIKAKRFANAEFDRRVGRKKIVARALIGEELDSWLAVKESENLDYDTLNNIRRARLQIGWYWENKLPSEITMDEAPLWYAWWKENHSDISIENAVKYMNTFCKYLTQKVVHGHAILAAAPRFKDPDAKIVLIKRKEKTKRIFTKEEFTTIYQKALNPVEGLAVLFMYTMATRVEETLSTEFGKHIVLDTAIPVYRWFEGSNKADLAGEHALHPSLIEPLRKLQAQRLLEGTCLVFPQQWDNQKPLKEQQIDWAAWRKRARIGFHWTSKTCRHSILSELLNDPRLPQVTVCKQYRVSMAVALETYVKTTKAAMMLLRDAVVVEL